jgi:hypothetical protein
MYGGGDSEANNRASKSVEHVRCEEKSAQAIGQRVIQGGLDVAHVTLIRACDV